MKQENLTLGSVELLAVDELEDVKVRFETLQQVCDLLSDLINNFEWENTQKNQLVYTWTQVIKVYWELCQKLGITPIPKK